MKKLSLDNLDELSIGSAILGSGGGGDPTYPFWMARYEVEKRGSVSLMSLSELKPDDLIVPIGFIGAPLAETEKFSSGREFIILLDILEKYLGKKINVLMPFEIGGGNAFTPLMIGAQLGYPVLDADTMGRAFPESQMSTYSLFNIDPSAFITDCLGNTTAIVAQNGYSLEKIARQITVAMGSIAAFSLYPISGEQAQTCTVPKSISKALAIGKAYLEAKKAGKDPLQSMLNLFKGTCIGSGKIIDINRVISKGFLNGTVIIQNKHERIELAFQNEYLVAKFNGKIVATTPDILMLLEQETGTPITSESLRYGLRVNLVAFPAPPMWATPAGLKLVGPRYFGYEVDYQPINKNRAFTLRG